MRAGLETGFHFLFRPLLDCGAQGRLWSCCLLGSVSFHAAASNCLPRRDAWS